MGEALAWKRGHRVVPNIGWSPTSGGPQHQVVPQRTYHMGVIENHHYNARNNKNIIGYSLLLTIHKDVRKSHYWVWCHYLIIIRRVVPLSSFITFLFVGVAIPVFTLYLFFFIFQYTETLSLHMWRKGSLLQCSLHYFLTAVALLSILYFIHIISKKRIMNWTWVDERT